MGVADDLLGRALGTPGRLRQELEKRWCSSLLELSGRKGYHVWVRLADPVPCFRLRRWLLIRSIGTLPEGIRVEEFPNRDRVKPDAIGPLVKLPLGVDSRTGKRCALLDDRGEELSDPFEAIRSLPRPSARVVSEAVTASPPTQTPKTDEIGPRARRLLQGCRVLGYPRPEVPPTSPPQDPAPAGTAGSGPTLEQLELWLVSYGVEVNRWTPPSHSRRGGAALLLPN